MYESAFSLDNSLSPRDVSTCAFPSSCISKCVQNPHVVEYPWKRGGAGREMDIQDERIDGGKPFDWGRTSEDYAAYRDIYPEEFYRRIVERGLCTNGQKILDVGTGTGVLPRNMHVYGGVWVGVDISDEQISQAKMLSQGMGIEYRVAPAEELDCPDESFDVVTACQCFWYFDHQRSAPLFRRLLKPGGKLLVLYLAWLPFEDEIAGASEQLVRKFNPLWSGAGETVHPIDIPDSYLEHFDLVHHEEWRLVWQTHSLRGKRRVEVSHGLVQ